MRDEKFRKALDELAQEREIEVGILDNHAYDNSVVGLTEDGKLIYDYEKMVEEYMEDEGCTEEEAMEWIDYNTMRALPYLGQTLLLLLLIPKNLLWKGMVNNMNKKKDVLDIFSKVMFFSKWNSPNPSEDNLKQREEDIEFVRTELERLVEIDRINELSKDTELLRCLEEIKNGLNGHCKSSYLKDNPEELNGVLDVYNGFFAKIEKSLKALEIIKKYLKPEEMEFYDTKTFYLTLNNAGEISQEEYELLKEILVDGGNIEGEE